MEKLLLISGSALTRMIRQGKVTSREVVQAHIDRIREVNPRLNAVVQERFAEALSEADAADELFCKKVTKLPPFHGVPCTIKECFELTGMPQTAGLLSRRGVVSQTDGPTVARLRQAGAIPLGVTNLSELCMWMESNNRVYGRTNNPYDFSRIVGGSSGGEGAIIGAGGSPFGLGSDIGGSIRMPAFFNGVFGHKPTGGLVPNTGQFPFVASNYLTTGPLCRRAEDLMPLLKILSGRERLGDPNGIDLSRLTVLDVEENGTHRVSRDLREAQARAASALEKLGAKIKRERPTGLKKSFEIWSTMLNDVGGPTFKVLLGNGRPFRPLKELSRWAVRRSDHTLPAIVLSAIEGFSSRPGWKKKYLAMGRALRKELVDRIGPNGVMLYPPFATPAPRHYWPMFSRFNWVYTAILNVMELPVTQVPLGLNKKGLPLGVQVVGIHGNDPLTIRVAMELEKSLGGWVPSNTMG